MCSLGSAAIRERAGAELVTLERFDATESHATLGADVARMAHAAYAAELVGKLCAPRQVETAVFDWLAAFLRLLDGDGASAERLRVFEIGLLSGLGYGPVLDTCAVCDGENFAGRPASEVAFRWDPDRGGAVCARARAAGGRSGRRCARRWAGCRAPRSPTRPPSRCRPTSTATAARPARDHQPPRERSAKSVEFIAKLARAGGQHERPARPPMLGIRHVALYVADLAAAERFWVDVMGYAVEWRPDPDNVYLCGARDNLALHRRRGVPSPAAWTTSASRSPPPGRRRCVGRVPERAGRAAEDAAQDAPGRLAVALLPRPRGSAHPDHPPLADGGG